MKKSEMLHLMQQVYPTPDGVYFVDHDLGLLKVLDAMEKAGMLPPDINSKSSILTEVVNKWESEL